SVGWRVRRKPVLANDVSHSGKQSSENVISCQKHRCQRMLDSGPGQAEALGASRIMQPRRFATVAAALCGTVVVAGLVVTRPGFSIDNTGAVPIEEQRSTCLTADVELANPWQLAPLERAAG